MVYSLFLSIFLVPETNLLLQHSLRTSILVQMQPFHFVLHTMMQNRHTILPGCQIHTSSRTSDRHCFKIAPLQPIRSADFQTNQKTGCHRNNTASHGERIGDLRNCSILAKLPVPVKIVKHWLLCIRLFAAPILCIRFHSYIPVMQVLTYPYPVGCCILPD